MLYLGHFSFDERDDDDEGGFGYFSCMVEAKGSSTNHVGSG